jgi:hypothetical protein
MESATLTDWLQPVFSESIARIGSVVEVRFQSGCLEFKSAAGSAVVVDQEYQSLSNVMLWIQAGPALAVLASKTASLVYRILIDNSETVELDALIRGEDVSLRFLSGSAAPDGSLLLLYERGLVCIDHDGNERWHRLHDDTSARIDEIRDGTVWLTTQWPVEFVGRSVGFDLSDGASHED